jgi:hypothetical protein
VTAENGDGHMGAEVLRVEGEVLARLLELRELFQRDQGWRDVNGIAAHLGKNPQTVQNMTGPNVADPIPFHWIHGAKWFYVPEVDAWGLGH